jgi:hypothetical protein
MTTAETTVNGSIYIGSYPSLASVYLDSEYQGTTPMTISSIAVGSYTILLELSGYSDWSDTIEVTSGNQTTVYEALTANTTTVTTTATTVTTSPATLAAVVSTIAATPQTTVSARSTTLRIPTPWPTDTPKASPVDLAVILGGTGIGLVVLRRK